LALWFDMTGIWGWSLPQLTGIQRVVVLVLEELLKTQPDIRLFRFDEPLKELRQFGFDELPPVILRNSLVASSDSINPSTAATDATRQLQDFLSIAHRRGATECS
jgi:hypothetical protein